MVWFIGASKDIAEAIQQIERNSDRAVGIIAAAILETHITKAIKRRWCNSPATISRILRPEGALGSFGPKIDLVFLMGLISPKGHQDMKLIQKIRNRFAHYLDVDTFETSLIREWCFHLKHFENFIDKDEELSGRPPSPAFNPTGKARKIFGGGGMNEKLKTAKGRYIAAIQVYSILFGFDYENYIPPPNNPVPIY